MIFKHHYLPDLSRNSNLLILLLVGQAFATIFWLFSSSGALDGARFAFISSYVMLIEILLLIQMKIYSDKMQKLSSFVGNCFFCFSVSLSFLIVEVYSQYILNNSPSFNLNYQRLIAVSIASVLSSLLLIRFFALLDILNKRNRDESDSRILALQARIQPHFLFNSLNTIAELTTISPTQAESAIESLSMLFRVSLEDDKNRHSLKREINLCERYLELESYRFEGEFLIEWSVSVEKPERWLVPKLLLQPIIENAIKFSPKSDLDSSVVLVSIKESNSMLSFKVENYVSDEVLNNHGNGIALQNIKDRLSVLYDDKQSLKTFIRDKRYLVLIQLPKEI